MNPRKEIYNTLFEKLQENKKIPRVIIQDLKDLFNQGDLITYSKIKTIIEKGVSNGD